MASKRYLWVMKSLIRKILREQGEDIHSQEDYDRVVNEKRIKKEVEMEKRIRILLKYISKLGFNVEEWLVQLKEDGPPNLYYNKLHNSQKNELFNMMKLFGGTAPRHMGALEISVLFVQTFLQNGGYGRDFDDGIMLDLTPIPYYNISGEIREKYMVWSTIWGKVYGAHSPEEAEDVFTNNPWSWSDDSDEQDREQLEVVNTDMNDINEDDIEWLPEMVGL